MANSPLFRHGRELIRRNEIDYNLPLTKWEKLSAGAYLILRDYASGLFPPTFTDQAKAYQAEMDFYEAMPGVAKASAVASHIVKPFWSASSFAYYSREFTRLLTVFQALEVKPGCRLLELGCGAGWMAEFLAIMGYNVVATTIAPDEIAIGEKRIAALRARGITDPERLRFRQTPMETVDTAVSDLPQFDAVFVFEALHHAFDWNQAIRAASRCIKPGGWLILANEPNELHTFISYRIGRLSNTHEIGLSQKQLKAELHKAGFRSTRVFWPRFNDRISHQWVAGRKQ